MNIIVVGAGVAGLRTVEGLRRGGHTGSITLLGDERHAPYHRPALSKSVLTEPAEPQQPSAILDPDRLAALDADLRLGIGAAQLDTDDRTLTLRDGTTLRWDRLVVATGVAPRMLPAWPDRGDVAVLRTFDDAVALRARLTSARRVLVVGAGVLGSEIAAAARARGVEVELVEPLAQPLLRVVGATVGDRIARLHRDRGVRLHLGTHVVELVDHGDHRRAALSDGTVVEADAVVLAVGSVPNVDWLAGSSVPVHPQGVVCDPTGWTGVEGVFAVGDVAAVRHHPDAEPRRLEHWTHAGEAARVVAGNLLVEPHQRRPVTALPYVWTDLHDVKLQTLGSPHPDDDLVVVEGDLDSLRFLALTARRGRVTGAVAADRPPLLMRARPAVEGAWPLERARREAPWAARPVVTAAP